MNEYKQFADIYVHLNQMKVPVVEGSVEKELRDSCGVYTTHYDKGDFRDAMYVSYDPGVITSEELLEIIRKSYIRAVKVASMLMMVRAD